MIDLKNFLSAISQIEEEKGISREVIIETIEMALAAAYKKDYGERGQMIRAKLDPETGSFKMWQEKIVVDETMIKSEEEIEQEQAEGISSDDEIVAAQDGEEPKKVRFNEEKHIMIDDAKKIDKKLKAGDTLVTNLELHEDFGRIAAQTAKQVIIQRIREAERDSVYEEYENKVDQIISGMVQRIEGGYIFFDIGKATGIMMAKDRMPNEHYRIGQRMRLYLLEIEQGPKGPQIYVSRSHPKMLSRLFELEVPEITSGTVVIKAVAREAGFRSKIAVSSTEDGIDPIGSCVGQRGTRVAAVIQELGGEKIDIIEWKEDVEEFISASLSPSKVLDVEADNGRAQVTVAEDQLSLAIGKDGQNVRLAAKLTGWKIDILSRETGEVEGSAEASVEADKSKKEDKKAASKDGEPKAKLKKKVTKNKEGKKDEEKKDKKVKKEKKEAASVKSSGEPKEKKKDKKEDTKGKPKKKTTKTKK